MTAKPIIKVLFFLLLSGPLTGQEEMLFE
ncbi:MAG: hypothetical protein RL013_434, partial [Bacteroidota bacterium]